MSTQKSTTWIVGTGILAVLLFAAAWMLAVGPKLTEASDADRARENVELQNQILQTEIVSLKTKFESIDQAKAELAALHAEMPTTGALAELNLQLDGAAVTAGVHITLITVQDAVSATPAVAPVVEVPSGDATPAPTDSATPATADPLSGSSTGAAGPVVNGLSATPVSVTVIGSYSGTMAFLKAVQTTLSRVVLVTGLTATSQAKSLESAGKPATERGDVALVITGLAFSLADVTAVPTTAPTEAAPALPQPPADKNPFAPAAGA